MTRLVIVEGPQRGASFDVSAGGAIGRAPGCIVRLEGRHLSRLHAKIEKRPEGLAIVDSESRNGVFVNGHKVKECLLKRDDEIEIGEFLFVYDPTVDVQEGAESLRTRPGATTILEALTDPFSGERPPDLAVGYERARLVLELAKSLHAEDDEKESLKNLLDRLMSALSAERGFIVLADDRGKVVPIAKKAPSGDEEFYVSNVLYHQVSKERRAVLGNDVARRGSREGQPITVLCAPLLFREGFLGFIYLDAPPERVKFALEDLRFVAATGHFAAAMLANARRLQKANLELNRAKRRLDADATLVAIPKELDEKISAAALSDATVLVVGEPGTGRELTARAIHSRGARSTGPFIAVHCGSLPADRLEVELFGQESAAEPKKGLLEVAQGGTIYLAEVEAASPEIQARFLRLVEERTFNRVGGTKIVKSDVRLVSGTSLNLEARVKEGKFRGDVYWRISGVTFKLEPLRERRIMIPALVGHFLSTLGARTAGALEDHIAPELLEWLKSQSWPGNVAQLRSVIEQMLLKAGGAKLTKEFTPTVVLSGKVSETRLSAEPEKKPVPAPEPKESKPSSPMEWKSVEM